MSFNSLLSVVELLLCSHVIVKDTSAKSWNRWALPFVLMYSKLLDNRKKREDELAVAVKCLALV